ncbi:hypothetical protein PQR68_29485 [Paraburkholderia agricolaris]|uniref:5-methylcytosine restriction system specificity protein McrC n=1 Tax=Paraburkholderia agricolaris TaxID=2152888 RepID=UPI0038B99EC1
MRDIASTDRTTPVVLTDGAECVLEGVSFRTISDERRKTLARFVEVLRWTDTSITIRKSKRLIVGRFALGKHLVVIPPPLATELFVPLLLYALQGDLRRYRPDEFSGTQVGSIRHDYFLKLMATLLVSHAETLLHGHISRTYRRQELRNSSLRGRVVWSRNFARHPSEGMICETFEQSSDDLLNALVLAGLESAVQLLRGAVGSAAAGTQLFIWRQLASARVPAAHDFDSADRLLSRLTDQYRAPLALARAITLGLAPRDLDVVGNASLNHLEFHIPSIFESFLMRILSPYAGRYGLSLGFKSVDRRALIDGHGQTYREIEPDIVVYRGGTPVGVIDAKFKPRYVERATVSSDSPEAKVTNADIYQLFFYQSRLQVSHGLPRPPRAVIIAPYLSDIGVGSVEKRTIIWAEEDNRTGDASSLSVLPIALGPVLQALRTLSEQDALETYAPEIAAELRSMAGGRVPL